MINLLAQNPLLLLFVVAAIGFLAGRLKVRGIGLGVAAVLFAGLAIGALDPALKLPEFVYLFGLVLFVYTVGLSSGPGFFASFRRRGLRDNAFGLALVALGAALAALAARALHLHGPRAAGLFAGALTNTPALASVLETLGSGTALRGPAREALLAEPVVAYSLTYPVGVVGVLAAIVLAQRMFAVDYAREAAALAGEGGAAGAGERLESVTARVTREEACRDALAQVRHAAGLHVAFGRVRRGEALAIVTDATRLAPGDLVTVIGPASDVRHAVDFLGELSHERLDLDRRALDFRRMFVSNPKVTETPLAELRLPQRYGAVVTRVRRGDVDLVPDDDTELELGDRVRVVAPRERLDAVATYLGDSYKALGEIDVITFGLGIALGLLLGQVPLPLPGGTVFRLGYAGGPLVVALLLGRVGRTGPLVWTLPYSANLTLRQLGLVLFLAGVGTRSGYAFASTLRQGGALPLLAAGAVITLAFALAALVIGHRVLKIPMGVMVGMLAGLQTQPAVLAFAAEQTRNELPNVGYATVYPLATIAKIVLAQLLLALV